MKKELFDRVVVDNRTLKKLIFYSVKQIHVQIKTRFTYSWEELIGTPYLLMKYKYYDLLENYILENELYLEDNGDLLCFLVELISLGRIDALKLILGKFRILNQEVLDFLVKQNFNNPRNRMFEFTHNLLAHAAKYGQSEIMQYLESLDCIDNQLWDYLDVAELSILSFDLDIFKHYINKSREYNINNKSTIEDQLLSRLNSFVENAALVGKIDILEWIYKNISKFTPTFKSMKYSIKNNHLDCLIYLRSLIDPTTNSPATNSNNSEPKSLIDSASKFNRLKIVKWLHFNSDETCINNAPTSAIDNNNIEMLKFLLLKRQEISEKSYIMLHAIKKNNLEIMKLLHKYSPKMSYPTVLLQDAFKTKNLDILKWIDKNLSLRNKQVITTNTVDEILSNYPMELVEWFNQLVAKDILHGKASEYAMIKAAYNNDFERLKWLHKNRTEGCSNEAISAASSHNNLEMMKWLLKNYESLGYAFPAFENTNNTEILDWLQQNNLLQSDTISSRSFSSGFSQQPNTTFSSFSSGFSQQSSTSFSSFSSGFSQSFNSYGPSQQQPPKVQVYLPNSVWIKAAEKGDIEKMKWLHSNRSEDYAQNVIKENKYTKSRILSCAIQSGNVDLLYWLNDMFPSAMENADHYLAMSYIFYPNSGKIKFDMIKWLFKIGHPKLVPKASDMNQAIRKDQLDIVIYLHKNFSIPITIEILEYAMKKNRLEIIQWILLTNSISIETIKEAASSWENNFRFFKDPYNLITNYINK